MNGRISVIKTLFFDTKTQRLLLFSSSVVLIFDIVIQKFRQNAVADIQRYGALDIMYKYTVIIIAEMFNLIVLEILKALFRYYARISIDAVHYEHLMNRSLMSVITAPSEPYVTDYRISSKALLKACEDIIYVIPFEVCRMASTLYSICFLKHGSMSCAVGLIFTMVIYIAIVVLAISWRMRQRNTLNRCRGERARIAGLAFENISTIRSNGSEKKVEALYGRTSSRYYKQNHVYFMVSEWYRLVMRSIFTALSLIIMHDKITNTGLFRGAFTLLLLEQVKTIRTAILRLRNTMFFFCEHWGEISVGDMKKNVDKIKNNEDKVIAFKDVVIKQERFQTGGLAIPDCSIEMGCVVQIMGQARDGTCMLQAIAGIEDYVGSIQVGGTEVGEIDKLHLQISLLSQRQELFDQSLYANVTFGMEMGEEEVLERLEGLGLLEHLKEVGLDKSVGIRGCKLSAGQIQLVCLSRALLRDRHIYLLDEPTASLDPVLREAAICSIQRLHGKTVVIASSEVLLEDCRKIYL